MVKKNYSCESSDSCSLVSITGISGVSSNIESSSTSYNKCSSSESSVSSSNSSFSNSCEKSSETTYSDNTTCKTSSSSTHESCRSNKCDSIKSELCEKECYKNCEKLVKKYNCAKEELLAISDIIIVLNFIKNKLIAVQPNVVLRHVEKYYVSENISWIECFVDTLFCVLRKNEAYKVIKVKECKLKNESDELIDSRTYLIKIKYLTKSGENCRNIPLIFNWNQLTSNDSKSYNGILNTVCRQIDEYVKGYQAAGTIPFLCN